MRKISLFKFQNDAFTLRDDANEQLMHSNIGAEAEAQVLYGKPGAQWIQNLPAATAWDVGFGTGSNGIALLKEWRDSPEHNCENLNLISFELYRETLEATLSHFSAFPHLAAFREQLEELYETGKTSGMFEKKKFTWEIRFGDFRKTHLIAPPPNLVFYDFYSPKTHPELWDSEIFQSIMNLSAQMPLRLFTYTSATWVRAHLSAAGFFIGKGESTDMKQETTEAANSCDRLTQPLPPEWAMKLDRSHSEKITDFVRERARLHPQWLKKSL
jgi:queuine tRNA-ribosyltransferase